MSNTGEKKPPGTALITGGSRRIGAAIAASLADAGTHIIVHHHSSDEEAAKLVKSLSDKGVTAMALAADLTDGDACKNLFAKAQEKVGHIDLLINNASIFEPDTLLAPDTENWRAHFAIHLEAPSIMASEMARQSGLDEGLVVNIIDQRVWRLNPGFYSYTLSKSALWTATRTMAQSLAPKIRVNAIGPGPTLPNKRQSQEDFQKQSKELLLRKGPQLTEFGETVLYLWQAKSVTGQMIALDGGQHLAWETPDISGIRE